MTPGLGQAGSGPGRPPEAGARVGSGARDAALTGGSAGPRPRPRPRSSPHSPAGRARYHSSRFASRPVPLPGSPSNMAPSLPGHDLPTGPRGGAERSTKAGGGGRTSGLPRRGPSRGGARSLVGPRPSCGPRPTNLSPAFVVTSLRTGPAEAIRAPPTGERRCGGRGGWGPEPAAGWRGQRVGAGRGPERAGGRSGLGAAPPSYEAAASGRRQPAASARRVRDGAASPHRLLISGWAGPSLGGSNTNNIPCHGFQSSSKSIFSDRLLFMPPC